MGNKLPKCWLLLLAGLSLFVGGTLAATTQPTTGTRPSGPEPVTLASMSAILSQYELDAEVTMRERAGQREIEVLVPPPGPHDPKGVMVPFFLVFPWGGESGIAKAREDLKNMSRPLTIAWSNEHWILIGDVPEHADDHMRGLKGRMTSALRKYRPVAEAPAKEHAAKRWALPEPKADAVKPPLAELVFQKQNRKTSPGQDIVLELRLVNKTQADQKYPRGFKLSNSRHESQLQIVTEQGDCWTCSAKVDPRYDNYDDIIIKPGENIAIGTWNLSTLQCEPGDNSPNPEKSKTVAEVLRLGTYYLRWWDGTSVTALYSPFNKIEIGK